MKKLFFLFFNLFSLSFFSQTLSTSLTACYSLDGNGNEPINNLNGVLSSVTPTVNRFNTPNSAFSFNGTASSFIQLPNSPLLKANLVSFSGWVKLTAINSQIVVFAHNGCVNFHEGYQLALSNLGPGNSRFQIAKANNTCSAGGQAILNGTTSISANTWYHIGFYAGPDSLKLYVNGTLDATLVNSNPLFYSGTANVYLGGTTLPVNLPLSGSLDNVRFYDRKLTDGEFNQLYLTDPSCLTTAITPNCSNSFYAITSAGVYESNTSVSNTSTLTTLPLPPGASGLAIGPAFSFPAPNPTYWTTVGGTYWYYNGTSFINTTHIAANTATTTGFTQNPGGSANFIYNFQNNIIYKYNGTGNSTVAASYFLNGLGPEDIVGDDQDNFYLLRTNNPQSLLVFNPSGVQTCSYIVAGLPFISAGEAFAIVGNTVTLANSLGYFVGTISGNTLTFTQTPVTFPAPFDFANCPVSTVFPSTITASPSASLTCLNPNITLTVNASLNPLTYTWTGPGIISSPNNQTVQVNVAGVYTCSLTTSSGCPSKTSVSTFTVINNVLTTTTPTITLTGSLSCTSSTAQLSVAPNSLTNTILWNGPGIVGLNNTPTVTINAAGIYSVTLTGIITGCSATQTINVPSNITTLTLNAVASNSQICFPSAPITLTVTGATNYTWAPIGSTLPGTGSIVISSPTINTTYTVIGTTGVCTGSTTISISVTATPTLIASGSPTVCSGAPTTLSVNGAANYTWMPGALTGPSVTVSPTITTNYTITGANGICTSSTTILVTAVPIPTITASATPTIICQGSSSTLTASGALTYTWQPGNLPGNTVTVSPLTTTIYSVTGTNLLGCTATKTVVLIVNNPTITVSPLSSTICAGQSATLSATGATSYTWNPGTFTTSSIVVTPTISTTYTLISISGVCTSTNTIFVSVSPNPTITLSPVNTTICSGNSATLTANGGITYTWMPLALNGSVIIVSPVTPTNYTVTGTNAFGCISTTVTTVSVNPSLTITATSNPTIICSGFPSLLTASGAQSYTWSPTGSNSSTLVVVPSVTSIFTVAGTNSLNCVSSQTVSILVSPTPTLSISSSPTVICNGSSATITALGATAYTWQPGALTGTSIVVSPTATTVYTVVGASGICSTIKTFTLVVLPRPNVTVTTVPPVVCNGGASLLFALGATNYTWSPGSSNGNTLVVTPSVTSSYTVTGINAIGCTNTAIATVSVNPNPTVTTVPSATLVCSGSSVTLTSNGAVNYLANPGAQTGSVIVITPTVSTTYTVTGINASGCTNSKTLTINVLANPVVTAASSGTLLCNGGSFSLSANGATNYTWMPIGSNGNSVVTTATNAVSVYTLFGESNGCVSSSTLSVLVINCNNSVFGMTKAAGKPVLIYNTFYNVDFTVTAVNASSLSLSSVTLNENLLAAFPSPTNFTVVNSPVITSQNSSLSINPAFDGTSQISLTSPATSTLLPNKRDTIVFTVRIDPRGYYGPFKNWIVGFANVLNNVTVLDSSNNGFAWDPDHDGDPTNNDSATVITLPVIDLFIPDGFSPNGDGKNDIFFIKGLNNRSVKLSIFNRWGNKIYEKSEYDNTWNGYPNVSNTIGNDKVPPATYYYIIEFLDGDKQTFTGFVVIQY